LIKSLAACACVPGSVGLSVLSLASAGLRSEAGQKDSELDCLRGLALVLSASLIVALLLCIFLFNHFESRMIGFGKKFNY
jgi:hypothetical protein